MESCLNPRTQPLRLRRAAPQNVRPCAFGVRVVVVLAVVLAGMGGCSRKKSYSQDTPDDVVRSAVAMVKNGDARRLPDLIYSDSPEMRSVLNQLGKLFESMQKLSVASAKHFPEEFQKLQDQALAAAEDPKNKGLMGQVMVGLNDFGSGKGPRRQMNADDIRAAFSGVLADPYGWLERNSARISTVKTADDTAAVMFDGEPAIPVVGLPMKLEKGKWYVVLPIRTPPLSNVMPRSKQQWQILGSVIRVADNAMVDLTADVNAGRVRGIKNLTDSFQDKVLFPIGIGFAAYMKELDVRGRVDRRLASLRTRQRAWAETRRKAAPEGSPGVSPKLLDAIGSIAPGKVEQIVRANKPLGVDKMSDGEFEDLVGSWLAEAGLRIRMDGDLYGEPIDKSVAQWQAERAAKATAAGKSSAPKKKT